MTPAFAAVVQRDVPDDGRHPRDEVRARVKVAPLAEPDDHRVLHHVLHHVLGARAGDVGGVRYGLVAPSSKGRLARHAHLLDVANGCPYCTAADASADGRDNKRALPRSFNAVVVPCFRRGAEVHRARRFPALERPMPFLPATRIARFGQ